MTQPSLTPRDSRTNPIWWQWLLCPACSRPVGAPGCPCPLRGSHHPNHSSVSRSQGRVWSKTSPGAGRAGLQLQRILSDSQPPCSAHPDPSPPHTWCCRQPTSAGRAKRSRASCRAGTSKIVLSKEGCVTNKPQAGNSGRWGQLSAKATSAEALIKVSLMLAATPKGIVLSTVN